MATEVLSEEFITIVPVEENRSAGVAVRDSTFVTVLTVGAAAGVTEVVVRRPRGARLGLGLKFEGGSAAAEKVRRLLVQSCAEDSPAANACAPWGKLIPGDEILAIDGVSVSELTRIDCVGRLKDSDEILTLLVRHFESDGSENKETDTMESSVSKQIEILRPTTLPPPVPPRKLGKKNSFKDKTTLQTVGERNALINTDLYNQTINGKDIPGNGQHNGISNVTKLSRKSSFDSHIHRQNKESIACLRKGSPEEVRRLVRRLSDGKAMPPEAEVYIDLLSSEWERCLLLADAESDDTGSSISTVVDRLSSMASSVENSIPSTPIMQPKTIDIQKVLNCIENIDSNILKDITSTKLLEKQPESNLETKKVSANIFTNTENNVPLGENGISIMNKLQQNDKNNNSTVIQSLASNNEPSKLFGDLKTENTIEKPKPMPRNTKIERNLSEIKPKIIPIPETPPPPIPEPLLTPTKKNCIETWLQRSEAEMNNKTVEKLEDVSVVPEVLPRLIDFVPKPQFKEPTMKDLPPLQRPTSAPPPPPPETREDGSGASLDTIGELDESTDVIDGKPYKPNVIENETTDRKPYTRSFWEDRINKSDNEDKSLSNDETPPPTCPRQPPDGVETPADAVDKIPDLPTRLPPRLPAGWPNARNRFSYTSRTQDARSEASVKDKIAMFSNDHAITTDHLDKCGTLPAKTSSITRKSTIPYTTNYSEVSTLDRRLTKSQDNLDELPRYKRTMDRPEVLGSVETAPVNNHINVSNNKQIISDNKPLFYGSTTTLSSNIEQPFAQTVYHARSSSDDNGNKNSHKSNLEYLIEQRKKSMSKLRGLVIPEIQGPIIDLPEIKVQDSLAKTLLLRPIPVIDISKVNKHKPSNLKPSILSDDSKWKASLIPSNLPKYSPAFKRKSLQVYTPSSMSKESTPERKLYEKSEALTRINNNINISTFRATLDNKTQINDKPLTSTLPSKLSANNINKLTNKDYRDIISSVRDYKNVEIKICTATDVVDSDNDSAMSSTQSSYRSSASSPMHTLDTVESDSSRISPKITHYATYSSIKGESATKTSIIEKTCEEYIKREVCRSVSSDTNVSLSSSAGSAATSGSQASCSSLESSVADFDKKKVSKPYNIDTINRRNILASAKCRSGRDANVKSPVIEAKFSHESYDRSPSPTRKTSDRLSTLTSSVSAVLNKGENRRRSKVIAETDSDSDSEKNVRQRKNDFKNTRIKRNSSTNNKNKHNETTVESTKVEEAPKVISEKIIREIKKAGLDNYPCKNNLVSTPDKSGIKTESIISRKQSVTKKDTILAKTEVIIPKQKINDVVDKGISKPVLVSSTHIINNSAVPDSISSKDVDQKHKKNISTQIIRLKRGDATGVGLILAGGIDCEAKDVTVHRVLPDSVAAKAGLKRGVKVRSINGTTMNGVTHAQSVTILKEQRSEVVIEIEHETRENKDRAGCGSEKAESKVQKEIAGSESIQDKATGSVVTVNVEKAGGGAGLGFGLDGGRDSPQGDRPLTIKKLFAGGAAAQSGRVLVGAELLSAGGKSLEGFTRTQAWAALKALPAGPVALVLRNPKIL